MASRWFSRLQCYECECNLVLDAISLNLTSQFASHNREFAEEKVRENTQKRKFNPPETPVFIGAKKTTIPPQPEAMKIFVQTFVAEIRNEYMNFLCFVIGIVCCEVVS
jgi:hypothetical protein